MQDIKIRDFQSITDESFVIDSWMKSFYANSPFTKYLSISEFKHNHIPIIKKLMAKSRIRMAVESEAPDVIIGYVVSEPGTTLHYLYVKEPFRGFGIAKRLLSECQFSNEARVTHLTDRGRKITMELGLIYSPYFE